eukprot:1172284-Rhodomonas_salina.1
MIIMISHGGRAEVSAGRGPAMPVGPRARATRRCDAGTPARPGGARAGGSTGRSPGTRKVGGTVPGPALKSLNLPVGLPG